MFEAHNSRADKWLLNDAHTTFKFIRDLNVWEFTCFFGRHLFLPFDTGWRRPGRLHPSLTKLPSPLPAPLCPHITPFIDTKQQPVPPTLHHCSAPAADAQLRFSRGALTSPPPPGQSSALFILSNTCCLARGGHVGCFAGTCHVSTVVHKSRNEEQRRFKRRKISTSLLQRGEKSPLKLAANVETTQTVSVQDYVLMAAVQEHFHNSLAHTLTHTGDIWSQCNSY